jgi:hypothetical protein
MAAHQHPSRTGWWDTPVHPLIGVVMFLAGIVAVWLLALFFAAQLIGR